MSGTAHEPPKADAPVLGGMAHGSSSATVTEYEAAFFARAEAEDAPQEPQGTPHLMVELATQRCLLPLNELRGVLDAPPKVVRFPFGPSWLLGVFLLRTELLALVDPNLVAGGRVRQRADDFSPWKNRADNDEARIVLAGSGERTLGLRLRGAFEYVAVLDSDVVRASAATEAPAEGIRSQYVTAMFAKDASSIPCPIIAVAPLLDDLCRLLAEERTDG